MGAIAAIGVLITGAVIDGATTPDAAPQAAMVVVAAQPPATSPLETKCDYFC